MIAVLPCAMIKSISPQRQRWFLATNISPCCSSRRKAWVSARCPSSSNASLCAGAVLWSVLVTFLGSSHGILAFGVRGLRVAHGMPDNSATLDLDLSAMQNAGEGIELNDAENSDARPYTRREASLYVVATPIGNMGDLSLRARAVLEQVDRIAAEDTRNTARMLDALGIKKPLMAHHAHNERESAQGVLACLQRGESVALVSDAGTPAVSDPGAVVVLSVVPVPGASSVLAVVAASGLVEGAFTFRGFLPAKGKSRLDELKKWLACAEPQVVFEAPHRVMQLVNDLESLDMGRRDMCAGRELTKQFETFYRGKGEQVFEQVRLDANAERGEWAWVIGGNPVADSDIATEQASANLDTWLGLLLAELPLKTAVAVVVKATGMAKNTVYNRALALKDAGQ
jgi:16S rRNA (cytidine1402-2'-O)-methyltransferase